MKHELPIAGSDGSPAPAQPIYHYRFCLDMEDGSPGQFAAAESRARLLSWHRGQVLASEYLFQIPPDPARRERTDAGAEKSTGIGIFQPWDLPLYVLSGCAPVGRESARALCEPGGMLPYSDQVAEEVANAAKQPCAEGPGGQRHSVGPKSVPPPYEGAISEPAPETHGSRASAARVAIASPSLPLLARYQVVVVGGGTAGAPAAIAAARKGLRTLVCEQAHGLGGVGTLGFIARYWYGNRTGFTAELDAGVAQASVQEADDREWDVEAKMHWYLAEACQGAADVWLGTVVTGVLQEGSRVTGVVVATPHGRGVVTADVVIDATGNADVAAAAGAACTGIDGSHIAVQGAGLPSYAPGDNYNNTDHTFIDDGDLEDWSHAFTVARHKFATAFDLGVLADTRERRRIRGRFELSPEDICGGREFADTIVEAASNFDTHGFTIHPLFLLRPPEERTSLAAHVPYRCLLPDGVEGVLVTGLGVSAHRDAMPVIRMQADVQNQGYAAGLAAWLAITGGCGVAEIEVARLQAELHGIGVLSRPRYVGNAGRSAQVDVDEVCERLQADFRDLEVLLAGGEDGQEALKRAYRAACGASRLPYAQVLGMMGDAAGARELIEWLDGHPWDAGWEYTGMGQFGASLSPFDSMLVALGRSRSPAGTAVIRCKAEQLPEAAAFSHCRALALACEELGDPSLCSPLTEILGRPEMTGHAFTSVREAIDATPSDAIDTTTRNRALKEIVLARALFRCGDRNGLGERLLRVYEGDLRVCFSRHARAVLAG